MSSMSYVVGVDGGGTHTRCLCATIQGEILAEAQTGAANPLRVGVPACVQTVVECILTACAKARLAEPPACVYCCLAGVGRETEYNAVLTGLSEALQVPHLYLDNDAEAALAGAHRLEPGIIVIAGTGAVAYGKDKTGRRARADGWGPVLGDEGSGAWIGREVVRAIARAADGRGPQTALTEAVLAHFELNNPTQLINKLPLDADLNLKLAGLAEICSQVAGRNDPVAVELLNRTGEILAQTVLALTSQFEADADLPVAYSGGVFESEIVRQVFCEYLMVKAPRIRVIVKQLLPVEGSILLALSKL